MASSTASNIVIKDDGNNIGRFYCLNAVMQSFFAKLSDMQLFSIEEAALAELSVEMKEEIMLTLKNVKIEIVAEENVIKEIA